jgi:hypothetical protein
MIMVKVFKCKNESFDGCYAGLLMSKYSFENIWYVETCISFTKMRNRWYVEPFKPHNGFGWSEK